MPAVKAWHFRSGREGAVSGTEWQQGDGSRGCGGRAGGKGEAVEPFEGGGAVSALESAANEKTRATLCSSCL